MLFLPEASDYITSEPKEMLSMAETLYGPIVNKYKEIAKENNIWISIGFHEKVQEVVNFKKLKILFVH